MFGIFISISQVVSTHYCAKYLHFWAKERIKSPCFKNFRHKIIKMRKLKEIFGTQESGGISRRGLLRGAGALSALAMLAALSGANDAQAGEAKAAINPGGQFQVVEPYSMLNSQLEGVRAGTAEISKGKIGIAIYGDNAAYIEAVERAVLYLRSKGLPIEVVWGDGAHAEGGMGIDVIINGYRILPAGGDTPPYPMEPDANLVAHAINSSLERWQEFEKAVAEKAQAAKPAPVSGG